MAQKKRRIDYEGVTLDLTYITGRIVAAGFPAQGLTAMYRNSRSGLVKFLEDKHHHMVKIYNLCAEASFEYTSTQVDGLPTGRFPFCDHNVCSVHRMV